MWNFKPLWILGTFERGTFTWNLGKPGALVHSFPAAAPNPEGPHRSETSEGPGRPRRRGISAPAPSIIRAASQKSQRRKGESGSWPKEKTVFLQKGHLGCRHSARNKTTNICRKRKLDGVFSDDLQRKLSPVGFVSQCHSPVAPTASLKWSWPL